MFGHDEAHCKKKGGTRIEWRPVQQSKTIGESSIQHPL